jgi:hypothetical protein
MPVQLKITYTYDALDRLIEAHYSNGSRVHYTYDPAGNRTAVVVSVVPGTPVQPPPASALVCPQCGKSVTASLQFCTNCGKKLK